MMKRILKILTWFFSFIWLISLIGILIPPSFTWLFSFFALFFPLFFTLTVLFLSIYIFYNFRYILILLAVVIVSILVLHPPVLWRDVKSRSSITSNDTTFSVLTHNVDIFKFYEKKTFDPEKWLTVYKRTSPDILCLQECFLPDTSTTFIRKNLLEPLSLKYFAYYPYIEIKGKGFAGMFIGSNSPVINKGFVLNNTPVGKKIIAIWADVLFSQGDTLRIFNVHLQSYHFSKEEREFLDMKARVAKRSYITNFLAKFRFNAYYRYLQARKLIEFIDSSPYDFVIVGDFNELPWSNIYRMFNVRFTDCYSYGNLFKDFRTLHFYLPLRVDYIFSKPSARFQPVFFRVIDSNLNDHYPVECRFVKNE